MNEYKPSARMALNLEGLRSFIAICEEGSFRRAAVRTHKSPSAVSLQIGKLEELLGVRLFERDARHVALTADGEALLRQARLLLGLNDETIALFKKSALTGHLFLFAPHDLGVTMVPRLLRSLAALHPNIQVDVRLGTSDDVRKGIRSGEANIALFNDVGPSSIPSRELYAEPLTWLMLNGGNSVRHEPLPVAMAEVGCAWRRVALDALQTANRHYRIAYSSDTSMGQVAALRADLAVAALPASLADRELIEVPASYELPPLPMTHIRIADDGSEFAKEVAMILTSGLKQTPQFLT